MVNNFLPNNGNATMSVAAILIAGFMPACGLAKPFEGPQLPPRTTVRSGLLGDTTLSISTIRGEELSLGMAEFNTKLAQFHADLASKQRSLDAEVAEALAAVAWELYEGE